MKLKLVILFIFLLSSGSSVACELTEEYKQTRTDYVRESRNAYAMCTSATSESKYWYKFVQCVEANDSSKHAGGCGHLAYAPSSAKYKSLDFDSSFCEKLKPTTEEMRAGFEDFIAKTGMHKCK
jgi:hypothetical protein